MVSLTIGELVNHESNHHFTFRELLKHRLAMFLLPTTILVLILAFLGFCYVPDDLERWDWDVHLKRNQTG
jgi:hypothetical protein